MDLTEEELFDFAATFERSPETALGFGNPSAFTRKLVSLGFVEQVLVEKGKYWRGKLTKAGKRVLAER